jgi:hypothetical protein
MWRHAFVFVVFLVWASSLKPQTKAALEPSIYASFGWHRIFYTNSTIRFQDRTTSNYDFSILKAKGVDDNDIQIGKGIESPQFTIKLGYFFRKHPHSGIELSYDHAKYVLVTNQRIHLQGSINNVYYDRDTILNSDFIEYEHTDGVNYYMLSFIKRKSIGPLRTKNHRAEWMIKPGGGLLIPRSETRMMGSHRNDKYHISGYVFGIESGIRFETARNLFAETGIKFAYARFTDVLLFGSGRAKQSWGSFQYLFLLTYDFRLKNISESSKK